jgi:DNA-binding transcriptional ArsR family regulator
VPPGREESPLLYLLGHPTRRAILRIVIAEGAPCSPVEMSRTIDARLSDVSYHVRQLADAEALALSGTEAVRGSIKHSYDLGPLVEDNRAVVDAILATD